MGNLGTSKIKVQLGTSAPGLTTTQRKNYQFEISGFNWHQINGSPFAPPLLVESVEDPNHKWSAIHLSGTTIVVTVTRGSIRL